MIVGFIHASNQIHITPAAYQGITWSLWWLLFVGLIWSSVSWCRFINVLVCDFWVCGVYWNEIQWINHDRSYLNIPTQRRRSQLLTLHFGHVLLGVSWLSELPLRAPCASFFLHSFFNPHKPVLFWLSLLRRSPEAVDASLCAHVVVLPALRLAAADLLQISCSLRISAQAQWGLGSVLTGSQRSVTRTAADDGGILRLTSAFNHVSRHA